MNDSAYKSPSTLAKPAFGGPQFLGQIAAYDPRLAYTLLQVPGLIRAGGFIDTGGWEIINLVGRFESGAANTQVQAKLQGIVEADLWVRRVTYTVRRPRAFAGNIFKAQSDYFNKLNPNIDFTLIVNSYCRYFISPEPTPLENIETVFECVCPAGLVLRCAASMVATFTIRRDLAPDEIPTEAIISLHCTRLPRDIYGACGSESILAALADVYSGYPGCPPTCP